MHSTQGHYPARIFEVRRLSEYNDRNDNVAFHVCSDGLTNAYKCHTSGFVLQSVALFWCIEEQEVGHLLVETKTCC